MNLKNVKMPSKHHDYRIGIYTYPNLDYIESHYTIHNKVSEDDFKDIMKQLSWKVKRSPGLKYPFILRSWKLPREAPVVGARFTSTGKLSALPTGRRVRDSDRIDEAIVHSVDRYEILETSSVKNKICRPNIRGGGIVL